jgi:hemerythrin
MALTWDDTLVMGIPELDEQHRRLFARIDSLLEAIRGGSSRAEVGRTLAFLSDYVNEHFAAEEALMREAAFPGLGSHVKEHAELVQDLVALTAEHQRDGPSPSLIVRVNRRVVDWLRQHIYRTDRDLAVFLQRRR